MQYTVVTTSFLPLRFCLNIILSILKMKQYIFAFLLFFIFSMTIGTSNAASVGDGNGQSIPSFKLNFCDSNEAKIDILDIMGSEGVIYSIVVRRETRITVRVKGNPTTGHSQKMTVCPDESIVKPVNTEPEYTPDPHKKMMVGYGGVYTFIFKAVGPGTTKAIIEYARYFEKPPKCVFKTEIEFIVTDECASKELMMSS